MFARPEVVTALCRRRMLGKRWHPLLVASVSLIQALVLLFPSRGAAYPWMIRSGYSECRACHIDPSGSGPLTEYGRYLGGEMLRTTSDGDEESSAGGFLFGVIKPPEWLHLGGDFRAMLQRTKVKGAPLVARTIWMQADLEAAITASGFVASGSLGYAPERALGAALTRSAEQNLVSRQHWLGYRHDASGVLVRLGRMNLPFGIRTVEHTLGVRQLTSTNINDQQQYGAAFSLSNELLRGELLAIAGNLQLRPDVYRERGYSMFVEWFPVERVAVGASSLITHRELDPSTLKETWRHAHGGFARVAPGWNRLVLLGEVDWVLSSSKDEFHRSGVVGYVQADLEFHQGMHLLATAEANNVGMVKRFWTRTLWASYAWFFAPHADLRLDGIYHSIGSSFGRQRAYTLLLQGHVWL